ncbi:MAG: MBL fold metallo-hydrolase, partial [Pseudomonadota bacterium]
MARLLAALVALALSFAAHAATPFDYRLKPEKIADDTWVLIGSTEDITRANGGNIVNTAFVVTKEGVVVIDS